MKALINQGVEKSYMEILAEKIHKGARVRVIDAQKDSPEWELNRKKNTTW